MFNVVSTGMTYRRKIVKGRFIKNNLKAWDYINAIDFSSIKHRVHTNNPKWSEKHIGLAIVSYKMFLYICRVYKDKKWKHAPDSSSDEVWHTHMLHTRQYFGDCKKIFGGYLHHKPASSWNERGKKERKSLQNAYTNTRRQMILTFGKEADPEVLFAPVAKEL